MPRTVCSHIVLNMLLYRAFTNAREVPQSLFILCAVYKIYKMHAISYFTDFYIPLVFQTHTVACALVHLDEEKESDLHADTVSTSQ
jgi:hypothetical protein